MVLAGMLLPGKKNANPFTDQFHTLRSQSPSRELPPAQLKPLPAFWLQEAGKKPSGPSGHRQLDFYLSKITHNGGRLTLPKEIRVL